MGLGFLKSILVIEENYVINHHQTTFQLQVLLVKQSLSDVIRKNTGQEETIFCLCGAKADYDVVI